MSEVDEAAASATFAINLLPQAKSDGGDVYVLLTPLIKALALKRHWVVVHILADSVMHHYLRYFPTVGEDGVERDEPYLPMQIVPGWLLTIEADQVRAEFRAGLEQYHKWAFSVLAKAFL